MSFYFCKNTALNRKPSLSMRPLENRWPKLVMIWTPAKHFVLQHHEYHVVVVDTPANGFNNPSKSDGVQTLVEIYLSKSLLSELSQILYIISHQILQDIHPVRG